MPPGDTIITTGPGHFSGLQVPDSVKQILEQLPDSIRQVISSALSSQAGHDGPHFYFPEWVMMLLLLGVFFIIYLLVSRLSLLQKKVSAGIRHKHSIRILRDKELVYDSILRKYNPYYSTLLPEQRHRFLTRTVQFMESKDFVFHSMDYEEHIPLLISGAAVQLTFGLKNFRMDYFSTIHVIRKEYILKYDNDTYFGHVSRTGIHIAWNHFMKGFEDYTDSVNVGLHEMAHAVSYDVFLGFSDHDDEKFKERLTGFSQKGIPVFRAMRKGASHMLSDYGTTNFDEFWAVCIESFFENAEEFRRTEPELYVSICQLLNQDPLTTGKIIDPVLAGEF